MLVHGGSSQYFGISLTVSWNLFIHRDGAKCLVRENNTTHAETRLEPSQCNKLTEMEDQKT